VRNFLHTLVEKFSTINSQSRAYLLTRFHDVMTVYANCAVKIIARMMTAVRGVDTESACGLICLKAMISGAFLAWFETSL
jgi:hypothetical protein